MVNLTCRGQPKLGPRQLEPLEGIRMEASQPLNGAGKSPPQTRAGRHPPRTRAGRHPPRTRAGRRPPPIRVGNRPPQAEARSKQPQGAQLTYPQRGKERVMVYGVIGTKGPSGGLKGERLSPKALPTQLGLHKRDGRPSAKFTTMWTVKTCPHAILPLRLSRPTILEPSLGH